MRVLHFAAIMFVCLLICASGYVAAQLAKTTDDEQRIRAADAAWSHASETKDVDQFISFYAYDASVLPFNAPIATGKEQVRQLWSALMSKPGFWLHFAPTKINVAKSGDLAYEVGTFELKLSDAAGNASSSPGKYVVGWKKQADGNWKAELDIFNTDK
jgi:uncharacterized protein (TIGR02246 family)